MRTYFLCCFFVSTLLFAVKAMATPDLNVREEVAAAAREAFLRGDFEELNRKMRAYRLNKDRSPSGLWLLSSYYLGIDYAARGPVDDNGNPDAGFAPFEKTTAQWVKAYPKLPAPHIAHATVLINHAWAYRGYGYSDTIDLKKMPSYWRFLAAARKHLEDNKRVASVDPQWYRTMLVIAMSENWSRERFNNLLNEALEREPLYYESYFKAAGYLLPKWHGNIHDLESFAQEAVKGTFESEGQGMYARVYWSASQEHFRDWLFSKSSAKWPQMRDGFDDIVRRYPDAWNLNSYAKFACWARDKNKARELLERIGDDIVHSAWMSESQRLACKNWVLYPAPRG